MKDKVLIFPSPLADFCTAPWGVLKVVENKVVLDYVKAFNRQRRMLDAGGNMSRMLRSPKWAVVKEFDWKDPLYFPTLREYLKILHQPVQGVARGQGARVVIEVIDGCSEKWHYDKANRDEVELIYRTFFTKLQDLDFVDFGTGNEWNKDDSTDVFREVVIPVFDEFKKVPFSYGPSYDYKDGPDLIVEHKQAASKRWGDATSFIIYKQVHGCKDYTSPNVRTATDYWAKHPMTTFFSVDGVKDGASPCDFYESQVRPSPVQYASILKYVLDYISAGRNPKYLLKTGQPKIAVEFISKVWNNDGCSALATKAVSEVYHNHFGSWPYNFGKYPNDWVQPTEPQPPIPQPPTPPVQEKPCSYFWNRHNYFAWFKCVFLGKH